MDVVSPIAKKEGKHPIAVGEPKTRLLIDTFIQFDSKRIARGDVSLSTPLRIIAPVIRKKRKCFESRVAFRRRVILVLFAGLFFLFKSSLALRISLSLLFHFPAAFFHRVLIFWHVRAFE